MSSKSPCPPNPPPQRNWQNRAKQGAEGPEPDCWEHPTSASSKPFSSLLVRREDFLPKLNHLSESMGTLLGLSSQPQESGWGLWGLGGGCDKSLCHNSMH